MSEDGLYFDQYDRGIDDNPYPVMARLRDEAPVWYNEKYDYWVLSRFEDVMNASRDAETFSSAYGTVLKMMEDDIRKIIVGYLETLEGRREFDFVEDFGRCIPMDVISSLLGIPHEDRKGINVRANQALHREEGQTELGPLQLDAMATNEAYFEELLQKLRQSPQDDLASIIATAPFKDDNGERQLTHHEARTLVRIIAHAGNETVARLLGSAGCLLAKYPQERQKLRDDPSLITSAVEELLRFEAPSAVQFRRVMKDIEIHGVAIPKDSNICLLTSSAGRDERQYEDPDVFNVSRKPRRHVTFGYGVHSCLGSSLARLEARIALEEVLKRVPDWEVDEANMKRVRTSTVRGFSHVPVRIL